jgi:hypothetical protein
VARAGRLAPLARASIEALQRRDFAWFGRLCGGREAWRWLSELAGRCLYLDIETTGLGAGADDVTVIGCWDGREARLFVRDQDLGQFPLFVRDYDLLVTYNGATFDAPFLRASFPGLKLPPVHLDLRYPLAALGYRGGLKVIEQVAGLGRESELLAVDGYTAVLLWQRHRRGDARALPTLKRYCLEDVLSLEPLAHLVYNRLAAEMPLDLPLLEMPPRAACELEWSPQLVAELGGRPY